MVQDVLILVVVNSARGYQDVHAEDNDSSSVDNNSVFSISASLPSIATSISRSRTDAIDKILIYELADLFHQDVYLMSLILIAISKENIGLGRMRNRFRKLIEQYAMDLRMEEVDEYQRSLVGFVRFYGDDITRELFSRESISQTAELQTTDTMPSRQGIDDRHKRVEKYLSGLDNGNERNKASQGKERDVVADSDEDSDRSSVDAEVSEEPYDGSLKHLQNLEEFILESVAYETLHYRLSDFVYPSLQSKLRDLAAMWSKPDHKHHATVDRYKLLNLIAELRLIDPQIIKIHYTEEAKYSFMTALGLCQNAIEQWTGEHWDWWPLPRGPKHLEKSDARVRWKCVSVFTM
jgi:hypothetical protein